jgi:iron complex transport system ATP-binding protein
MNIRINGIEFGYSGAPVLKDVRLNIEGAQLVSILGPNGVGKSTLINCICKILGPEKGAVLLDGKDLKEINIRDLAKEVGYVPCTASDTFPLNVVDAVLLGRHPHSRWGSLDTDLKKVHEVLKRLGIEDLAMRGFNELSAGQRQKVVLARGFVQETPVLLLDEPTSNLDIKHQIDVSELLRDLSREKNMLIIMISHDINIAARYSDNIVLMHMGSIYSVGTPEDVITEENVRTVYGVDSKIITANGRPHMIINHSVKPTGAPDNSGKLTNSDKDASAINRPERSNNFYDAE